MSCKKKKKGVGKIKILFENEPIFKGGFSSEKDLDDTLNTIRRKLF